MNERAESVPPPQASPAQVQRDPYIAFVLRWWWLIGIGLLVGSAGGYAYQTYGPVPYSTTALIQVLPQTSAGPTDPNAQAVQARNATVDYTAEIASGPTMSLVRQALAGKPNVGAANLTSMANKGTLVVEQASSGANFIRITVTDTDPARAMLIANTYAKVAVDQINANAARQLAQSETQLQQQITDTRQRLVTAQLLQRKLDLTNQLQTERTTLLNAQSSYQQELLRQQQLPSTQPKTPQLDQVESQWLQVISDQITQIQGNINDTTAQIKAVDDQISKLTPPPDPAVSAAFASAYQTQLTNLTSTYAQMQLGGQGAAAPIGMFGQASDPLPTTGLKKTLMEGAALGLALAAGLGFGIDQLRRRRSYLASEPGPVEVAPRAPAEGARALQSLVGVTPSSNVRSGNGYLAAAAAPADWEMMVSGDDASSQPGSATQWPKKP